jgi:ubiquinone/menaquinone biosynthesis C-methylase UbiE
MVSKIPTAIFDNVAATYDDDFTNTALGRILRTRVWTVMEKYFKPGDHILELNCGTGEDALWLMNHGMRVTMTDASPRMIDQSSKKLQRAGFNATAYAYSIQTLMHQDWNQMFDGALSNFGGLNALRDLSILGQGLYKMLRPGANFIAVLMGPICPYEIAYFLLQGKPRRAFRRLRRETIAHIGGQPLRVNYHSHRKLTSSLNQVFEKIWIGSLGLVLPPTDTRYFRRSSAILKNLNWLDMAFSPYADGMGDHFIAVFRRR